MTPALEGKIEEAKKKITDFKARAAFEYVKLKQFIKRYMGNSTTFFQDAIWMACVSEEVSSRLRNMAGGEQGEDQGNDKKGEGWVRGTWYKSKKSWVALIPRFNLTNTSVIADEPRHQQAQTRGQMAKVVGEPKPQSDQPAT